jgi:hypothetical protein
MYRNKTDFMSRFQQVYISRGNERNFILLFRFTLLRREDPKSAVKKEQ